MERQRERGRDRPIDRQVNRSGKTCSKDKEAMG